MKDIITSLKFLKAGARELIYYNPNKVRAAIVTCGGLCPGLNVVIREVVMMMKYNYEVTDIWGIRWGYKGFYTNTDTNWVKLDTKEVRDIHKKGGTMLGSSRGGFDADKILDEIKRRKVN